METAAKYDRWRMTEPYTIIPAILTGTPADAEAAYKYTWDLYESLSLQEIARDPGIIRRITPFFHFPTAAKAKEYAEALANIENEYRKARANQAKRVSVGDQASIYTEIFKQYGADKLREAGFSARLSESGGNVAIVIRDVFATIASNVFMDSVVYRETMIEAFQRNRLPNDEQTQESLDNAYSYMQLDYIPRLFISADIEEQQRETPIDYLEIIKSKCPRALKEIEMAKELLNKAQYPGAIPELAMIALADKLDAAIRESGGILPAKDRPKPIKEANKRGGGRKRGMGKSASNAFINNDAVYKRAMDRFQLWDGRDLQIATITDGNRPLYGVVANLGHDNQPTTLSDEQRALCKGLINLSEDNRATEGSVIPYTPMQIKRAYLNTESNDLTMTPKEQYDIAMLALSLNAFIISCDVEKGYTDAVGNQVKGEKLKYPQSNNIVSRPIVHTEIIWSKGKGLIDDKTGKVYPLCECVKVLGRPALSQRADELSRVERIPFSKSQPVAEKRTVKTKDGEKRTATTRPSRTASRASITTFFLKEWGICLRNKTYRQAAGKGRVFNLDENRDRQGLYQQFGVIKENYMPAGEDIDQGKAKNRYKQACSRLRTKLKSILNGLVENESIPAWHYNYEGKNNTGEVISVSIFESKAAEKKARS